MRTGHPGAVSRMAESVTRHAQISWNGDCRCLVTGIDTLHLGLYVDWGNGWAALDRALSEAKEGAQYTKGVQCSLGIHETCLAFPAGKPNYKYHVQVDDAHFWIAAKGLSDWSPNVYAMPSCKSLWDDGAEAAAYKLCSVVARLGGKVQKVKVSRADLAADFELSEPLTLDLLRGCRVSRSNQTRHFEHGGKLESFYVGSGWSLVQARIYDKWLESIASGKKAWFQDVWREREWPNVWRVEFQLRRKILKQFHVETVEDLLAKIAGIWKYLTEEWLSFRYADDENVSRRSVHPWWERVQGCAEGFGEIIGVKREPGSGRDAGCRWYVSHIAGCLTAYAARKGMADWSEAAAALLDDLNRYYEGHDFRKGYILKRMALGLPMDETNGDGHE